MGKLLRAPIQAHPHQAFNICAKWPRVLKRLWDVGQASLVCVTFKQACMQVSSRAAEVLRVSLAQGVFRAELFKQGGLPNPNAHQAVGGRPKGLKN